MTEVIIDSHAHIVMPPESFRFMAELIGGRANPHTLPKIADASVRKVAEELVKTMDSVGTDVQFTSPRPYLQMHSVKPGKVTELWSRHCNDLIARFVEMFHAGRYDTTALATRVVGLRDVLGAYEEVAYRTTITALMVL